MHFEISLSLIAHGKRQVNENLRVSDLASERRAPRHFQRKTFLGHGRRLPCILRKGAAFHSIASGRAGSS